MIVLQRVCVRLSLSIFCVLLLSSRCDASEVIDSFGDADAWSLILADGVQGEVVAVDGALRLDYDFTSGAGYCVLRQAVTRTLDPNYRFALRYRGDGPRNTLEFKLIDPSGENVWWAVDRDLQFPTEWSTNSMRRRHFSFAWGPSAGAPLAKLGAIEIAVTATQGGKGSVWLDELVYETLPQVEPKPVGAIVRTPEGDDLGRVAPDGSMQWSTRSGRSVDFVFDGPVEFSGLELQWAEDMAPPLYEVQQSVNGVDFQPMGVVRASNGRGDTLFAPESEAWIIRLRVPEGNAMLEGIRFTQVEQWTDANAYFSTLASQAQRGVYPQYFEALSPWTVIGLPEQGHEALISATGAIEPQKSGYTIEPFLIRDGHVLTWADAERSHSLDSNALPIPSVHWQLDGLRLDITALATDLDGPERLLVRYTLTNASTQTQDIALALAARPFQVLPAAQFLNTVGGVAHADSLRIDPSTVRVDGDLFLQTNTQADAILSADVPSGTLVDRMLEPQRWQQEAIVETGQFPSAASRYNMRLQPNESKDVVVLLPMGDAGLHETASRTLLDFDQAIGHERARWQGLLEGTDILVPASHAALRDTIRANLGYILINADGPGIQPGSRSYERSWIRDGAMTSAALIALGREDHARRFIEWYSEYQYCNGKIPCVVDSRGPDPVDEHDAPGEFIFAIRNVAQAGGVFDEAFARTMFPRVRATVDYIEMMRNTRLSDEYTQSSDPLVRACAGLMPESISHEGYSEKPMHSYWDDFWIYRGLWDAAEIAELLGESDDAARFTTLAIDFGQSLRDSVDLATIAHGINYVPGCVELGDFDATSTSIAFYPTGAGDVLDEDLLRATFERAWAATEGRIKGDTWRDMTPYEVRTVGTFVRLGWVDRAHRYLDWLMGLQDPSGWHQWGEIAYQENEPCRFVGDMPHTWVGSGAVLSILSLFAYEDDHALVLAGGIPSDWMRADQPVGVQGLVTRYGTLSYTITKDEQVIEMEIEPGCMPPGGFHLDDATLRRLLGGAEPTQGIQIQVDGQPTSLDASGGLVLNANTKRVRIQ